MQGWSRQVIFKEDPKNGLVRVEPKVAGVSGVYTPESPVKNVLKNEKVEWVITVIFKTLSLWSAKKRFKIDQGKVQVQDGHIEDSIFLKLAIYLMVMDMWRCAKWGSPILSMDELMWVFVKQIQASTIKKGVPSWGEQRSSSSSSSGMRKAKVWSW